jgi:hypothetical protein
MPNWNEVLNEINLEIQNGIGAAQAAQDTVRRRYLGRLFDYTQHHSLLLGISFKTRT